MHGLLINRRGLRDDDLVSMWLTIFYKVLDRHDSTVSHAIATADAAVKAFTDRISTDS